MQPPTKNQQTAKGSELVDDCSRLHDRILRLSHAPTLDSRQRKMIDWSSMPLLESQLDRHPLAGTTDEDFQFGLARLIGR